MKAEELRKGNLIQRETYLGEWEQITYHPDRHHQIVNAPKQFKPIELNPSWLERMGAEYDNYYYKFDDQIYIHYYENLDKSMDVFKGDENILQDIKYVHQLQNLYFALTGKEIEIKQLEKV